MAGMETLFPSHYLQRFLEEGIRPDARHFQFIRATSYNSGIIQSSGGSSVVRIGDTSVIAGITLSPIAIPVGRKFSGRIQVSVELGPICSMNVQSGKQSEYAFALSQFIDRLLVEGSVVDPSGLNIADGVEWLLNLTITCTNYDGNVMDASILASIAALIDAKLPSVEVDLKGRVVETEHPSRKLIVRSIPLSLTFAVFDGPNSSMLLVDPTSCEEVSCNSLVTVVVLVPNEPTKLGTVKSCDNCKVIVHKPGGSAIAVPLLKEAVERARRRAKDLIGLMEENLFPEMSD